MPRRATGVARVRDYIDTSNFRDQDRLPPEPELARILQLTRGQVRTALRQLSEEGVVWRHVGRGTFLGARPPVPSQKPSIRSVNPRELMEARLALEPRLARLATISASEEDFEKLDACLAACETATDWREFQKWDVQLHRTIAEAARNSLMLELYTAINLPQHDRIWGRLKERALSDEWRREYQTHHAECVEAMRNRDPDLAERIMYHHLEVVQGRLFARS